MCVCVRARACVRVCVRVGECVCACVCVCARAGVHNLAYRKLAAQMQPLKSSIPNPPAPVCLGVPSAPEPRFLTPEARSQNTEPRRQNAEARCQSRATDVLCTKLASSPVARLARAESEGSLGSATASAAQLGPTLYHFQRMQMLLVKHPAKISSAKVIACIHWGDTYDCHCEGSRSNTTVLVRCARGR